MDRDIVEREPPLRSVVARGSRPPLPKQIVWTLAGNLGYAATQWGMLIVLTKTVSPAIVGQFGLGLAISTPVLMLTNLQLRSLQATRASDGFEFRDYLGFRLLSTGLALLAIFGIAIVGRFGHGLLLVVVAVGLAKCIESVADTIYGHLQMKELMDKIAISMVAKGVLSLASLAVVMWLFRDMFVGSLAIGIASLAVLLAYDLRCARIAGSDGTPSGLSESAGQAAQLSPRWRRSTMRAIARMGLPLGVTSLLLALANSVPRFFIEHWHGEEALGYFTALAHPTAAFSILLSAFGQAATPRMAEFYRSNRKEFWRIVLILAAVPLITIAIVAPITLAIGPSILTWFYRPEYAQHFGVFILLLVAGTLWSLASVLGYAATSSGRLAGQAPIAGLICVVALIAAGVTIRPFGLKGAAVAAIASGAAAIITYAILLLRKTGVERRLSS